MPDVLAMPALQLRHPMSLVVPVKAGNRTVHQMNVAD